MSDRFPNLSGPARRTGWKTGPTGRDQRDGFFSDGGPPAGGYTRPHVRRHPPPGRRRGRRPPGRRRPAPARLRRAAQARRRAHGRRRPPATPSSPPPWSTRRTCGWSGDQRVRRPRALLRRRRRGHAPHPRRRRPPQRTRASTAAAGPGSSCPTSPAPDPDDRLLALDEALTRLAAEDPAAARVVELRHFAGLRPRAGRATPSACTVYGARQMGLRPGLAPGPADRRG